MDPGATPAATTVDPSSTAAITTTVDPSSITAPPTETPNDAVSRSTFILWPQYQHFLDKSTPFLLYRWIAFSIIAVIYAVRVLYIQGFYVVSYALGIYILNLLIGFLSPQVDPQFLELSDDPSLPIRSSDEFRPFVRRLPEFKFCLNQAQHKHLKSPLIVAHLFAFLLFCTTRYSITKAFLIAFVFTFFSIFDVPVFWPILLFYWVVLFGVTMKKQILHMVKYKYVPFTIGKQRYDGKMEGSSESEDLVP